LLVSANDSNLLGLLLASHDTNLLCESANHYWIGFISREIHEIVLDVLNLLADFATDTASQVDVLWVRIGDLLDCVNERFGQADSLEVCFRELRR
jgi:hypothetical protein